MELPELKVGVNEVHEMIRGYSGPGPDPIECLQQAEGPEWKLDGCRFLLSQALTDEFEERHQAYFVECAAGMLASVFDVLLHEIVHYYGIDTSIPPRAVRWSQGFRDRLASEDSDLLELLNDARQAPWYRKAMGLRHYVTHHAGLLQLVAVELPAGRQTYSLVGDEYFEQNSGIDPPESFVNGYLDRSALIDEVIGYLGEMCGLVDRVRLHCFENAPVFRAGRERQKTAESHDV